MGFDYPETKGERREKRHKIKRKMKVSGAGLRNIWQKTVEKSKKLGGNSNGG